MAARLGFVGLVCLLLLLAGASVAAARAALVFWPDRIEGLESYQPDYLLNIPAFDASGSPAIRSRDESQDATGWIERLQGGVWTRCDFLAALRRDIPGFVATRNAGGWETDRLVFAADGCLYTALTALLKSGAERHVLLRSADGGSTWTAHVLPMGGARATVSGLDLGDMAFEHSVGHNRVSGPPFFAFWRRIGPAPGYWAERNALYVAQPRLREGQVSVRPLLVSRRCFGMCQVAGGSSFAVTRGSRTFFVWGEVAPVGERRGSPIFVATFSHGKIMGKTRVGFAKPANNVHCSPAICMDAKGFLHVVIGSHGGSFQYVRSRRPLSSSAGWTKPTPVLRRGLTSGGGASAGQTYAGLVCDAAGTLHLAFRQWRVGQAAFDGLPHAALCVQRRPADGGWSAPVVVAEAWPDYATFYHKLAVDPAGGLYLSLSYWTRRRDGLLPPAERRAHRYRDRVVVYSGDGGLEWRPLETADLIGR